MHELESECVCRDVITPWNSFCQWKMNEPWPYILKQGSVLEITKIPPRNSYDSIFYAIRCSLEIQLIKVKSMYIIFL